MKSISGKYHILSLKNSDNDGLWWYRPNSSGYTGYVSRAGIYDEKGALLNTLDCVTIAVPVELAKRLSELAVPVEFLSSLKEGALKP